MVRPSGAAGRQRRHHRRGVGGVGHQEDLVVADVVGDQVVDHAAGLVAAQRVLRLARPDPVEVVGECGVDVLRGARPAHERLAEVADVEQADGGARRGVLADGAGIGDRHQPAAELREGRAELPVPVLEWAVEGIAHPSHLRVDAREPREHRIPVPHRDRRLLAAPPGGGRDGADRARRQRRRRTVGARRGLASARRRGRGDRGGAARGRRDRRRGSDPPARRPGAAGGQRADGRTRHAAGRVAGRHGPAGRGCRGQVAGQGGGRRDHTVGGRPRRRR